MPELMYDPKRDIIQALKAFKEMVKARQDSIPLTVLVRPEDLDKFMQALVDAGIIKALKLNVCKACGQPIWLTNYGYWDYQGDYKPRHIAELKE